MDRKPSKRGFGQKFWGSWLVIYPYIFQISFCEMSVILAYYFLVFYITILAINYNPFVNVKHSISKFQIEKTQTPFYTHTP